MGEGLMRARAATKATRKATEKPDCQYHLDKHYLCRFCVCCHPKV